MALDIMLDPYIVDTLMRDLTSHDKQPSAFLVYLYLWRETYGNTKNATSDHKGRPTLRISLQHLAFAIGLSKSAVQLALKNLKRRKLVVQYMKSTTSVPVYRVLRPWLRRRG